MLRGALAALLLSAAGRAQAGLSFVQVSQAQTDLGADGLFGKTWVELSGRRMRLVSGYARKVSAVRETSEPERVIQIIDLDRKERLVIYPERRGYARLPLTEVGYGKSLEEAAPREDGPWALKVRRVRRRGTGRTRSLLGAACEHHRVTAELELSAPGGRKRLARMEQDVWVAPVGGPLSASALELIGFESAFREAAGAGISPLDYERYQVREAASRLGAAPAELMKAVERVRRELRELPGYPVASSVAWIRLETPPREDRAPQAPPPEPAPSRKARLVAVPSLYPSRVGTSVAAHSHEDWSDSERRINRMYGRVKTHFRPFRIEGETRRSRARWEFLRLKSKTPITRRSSAEPLLYPRFRDDMRRAIAFLRQPDQAPAPSEAGRPEPARDKPFYEVYAELSGLEASVEVKPADLEPPPDYAELR